MDLRWPEIEDDLASGDTDRANRAIDAIGSLEPYERLELADRRFDDIRALYAASDDGYVRQSVVRVVEELVPGLVAVVALDHEDGPLATDQRTQAMTDEHCEFLLTAITDDDGRVSQAAIRGLKHVARTYDAIDDDAANEALVQELTALADETSGTTRDQVIEAKGEVAFFQKGALARTVEGMAEELMDRDLEQSN